jgi:GTPase
MIAISLGCFATGKLVDVRSEYDATVGGRKGQVGVVVLGHVDAGKSTLMGHLLHLCGLVNKRQMHKCVFLCVMRCFCLCV